MGIRTIHPPSQIFFVPRNRLNAPNGDVRQNLPVVYSTTLRGIDQKNNDMNQAIRNVKLPKAMLSYEIDSIPWQLETVAMMRGNRQIFPVPITQPTQHNNIPNEDSNVFSSRVLVFDSSFCCDVCDVIYIA